MWAAILRASSARIATACERESSLVFFCFAMGNPLCSSMLSIPPIRLLHAQKTDGLEE
jgi:hypothetical protein